MHRPPRSLFALAALVTLAGCSEPPASKILAPTVPASVRAPEDAGMRAFPLRPPTRVANYGYVANPYFGLVRSVAVRQTADGLDATITFDRPLRAGFEFQLEVDDRRSELLLTTHTDPGFGALYFDGTTVAPMGDFDWDAVGATLRAHWTGASVAWHPSECALSMTAGPAWGEWEAPIGNAAVADR